MHVFRETIHRVMGDSLVKNSYFLIASSVVNSASTAIFWLISARFFDSSLIGVAAAFVSMWSFLTLISSLGMGIGLVRYLGGSERNQMELISTTTITVGVASLGVSVLFLAGADIWAPGFVLYRRDILLSSIFVAYSTAFALYYILSCVFLARRDNSTMFRLNILGAFVKVTALLVLASQFRPGLFGLVFVAGLSAVTVILVGWISVLPFIFQPIAHRIVFRLRRIRDLAAYSSANYVSKLCIEAVPLVLPLVVLNMLGSVAAAHFFIAWSLFLFMTVIPTSVLNSMFAEGAGNLGSLAIISKKAQRLLASSVVPVALLVAFLSRPLLGLFGNEYAEGGTWLLRILAFSLIPYSINYYSISTSRIKVTMTRLLIVSIGFCVVPLVLIVYLIGPLDLEGVGIGWILGQALISILIIMRKPIVWMSRVYLVDK